MHTHTPQIAVEIVELSAERTAVSLIPSPTLLVRQFPGPERVTEASAQSACPTACRAVPPIGSRTSRSSVARKAWSVE
ncbi:hypothetical protein K0M31_015596 [Melipona bicolor]|uniref:Uncharacterized protein n=1 Tax=Melipona bicolor TaxID=60889 RepID=A0AA40FF81_9HYME|nr:hypothetical protein K0M31_015596 [Melipona bicolor]